MIMIKVICFHNDINTANDDNVKNSDINNNDDDNINIIIVIIIIMIIMI